MKKEALNKIFIACDHGGFDLKQKIMSQLSDLPWFDLGTHDDESVDYPDYANELAQNITEDDLGILICGTGQGMAMRANKFPQIRAALCWTPEIAKLSRSHNNANILCLPGRFIEASQGIQMLQIFISTDFEGGRHDNRVKKINDPVT